MNLGADSENWSSFEAAHIFPLESESYWIHEGYGQWITDMDGTTENSKTHSLQNGFLLRSHIHNCFDQYLLSVNPDVSRISQTCYFISFFSFFFIKKSHNPVAGGAFYS